MGEYKSISITNVSLPYDVWQSVFLRLKNLDKFVQLKSDKITFFGGKSTIKKVYSVDCGAITSEYNAFRLAVSFYIGSHLSGVCIEEMK